MVHTNPINIDIDLKVKGKSYSILKKNKIKVKRGLLKKDAINLYRSYSINRKKKLPYVIGKIALSNNNLIYSQFSKRITDQVSDKLTHYLRYKNDSIMISSKTLNTDNPKLNCRLKGFDKFSPRRIILDRNLEIKINSYIFKSAKKYGNILVVSVTNDKFVNKGPGRPAFSINNRLKFLQEIECIDYLYTSNDPTSEKVIKN